MKRIEPESIGDVLRLTVQQSNMATRLDECKAADMWAPMMGESIASRTSKPRISCGLMIVDVTAAPLRHELNMNRSRIMKMINQRLGKDIIKEIRFR